MDLTKSLTKADYKRDLINCSNLSDRLKKCKFDITKIWAEIPKNNFKKYGNDSEKIKIKSKISIYLWIFYTNHNMAVLP